MKSLVIAFAFGLFGIGMLVPAAIVHQRNVERIENGVKVSGTVTGVAPRTSTSRDSDGRTTTSTTYAPVYSYTDPTGTERTYTASTSSSSQPTVGEQVDLYVDPKDPTKVIADTFMDRWFLPLLLGGMGAAFTIVGVVVGLLVLRVQGRDPLGDDALASGGDGPPPPPNRSGPFM